MHFTATRGSGETAKQASCCRCSVNSQALRRKAGGLCILQPLVAAGRLQSGLPAAGVRLIEAMIPRFLRNGGFFALIRRAVNFPGWSNEPTAVRSCHCEERSDVAISRYKHPTTEVPKTSSSPLPDSLYGTERSNRRLPRFARNDSGNSGLLLLF